MKKKSVIMIGMIAAVFLIYFFGPGFMKNAAVYIEDYTVNADGSEITIHTGMASSMGYIRKASISQQEGGHLYVDFYGAFGGMNGSIGAKNVYTLPLKEETDIIGIYRNPNCYEQVLVKDDDGVWKKRHSSAQTY